MSSLGRAFSVCVVCFMLFLVVSLPIWLISTRFWGVGSMNGGWLLVFGFVSALLAFRGWMLPICDSSTMRALWSSYSVEKVDMYILSSV